MMRGLSQQQCLDLIAKDVRLVKQEAVGIIIISPDNKDFEFIENKNPRLGVLAIVGPGQGFGQKFKQVLLAEIGLGPSRPYREARGLKRQAGQSNLPKRRKWFDLSAEQYCLIAPFVFDFLIEKSRQRVTKWKNPYFSLPVVRKKYWTRKHKKVISNIKRVDVYQGARFSVSRGDNWFLRDIYWAELNLNKLLTQKLHGIACFIDKRVNYYKYQYKGKKRFEKLAAARDISEDTMNLPLYLRKELVERLPKKEETLFYLEIQELLGLAGLELPEQPLAKEAENLPSPEGRLGKIQLRVTTGLDKGRDHIVFEVVPPIEPKKAEESTEDSLDDIPF